jgi:hypothetical protein
MVYEVFEEEQDVKQAAKRIENEWMLTVEA